MRLIHRLRLSPAAAARLDILYHLAYAAPRTDAAVQAAFVADVEAFAETLFYSRTLTRPDGWKWSYHAATLYISAK